MKQQHVYTVILDFKFAQLGNCGIGSDVQTTLQALCAGSGKSKDKAMHIDFLVYPRKLGNGGFSIKDSSNVDQQLNALSHALDLDAPTAFRRFPFIQSILKRGWIFRAIAELFCSKMEVKKINRYLFADILNRHLFKSSFGNLEQELPQLKNSEVLVGNYSYIKLLLQHFINAYLPWFRSSATLDTSKYDFFITQWWNPFQVSKNTAVLLRYHDSAPITNFDNTPIQRFYFFKLIRRRVKDVFFICNSEPTKSKLLQVLPDAQGKAFVVPCAVSSLYKRTEDSNRLKSILLLYWSGFSLKDCSEQKAKAIKEKLFDEGVSKYILFVSSLVPHKNLVSVIKAWHPLFIKHGLKLVVCGANPNFKEKEIIKYMAPMVESGALIHLEKVPVQDMPVLYSHAQALISPSYSEGFGLPVVEAMSCKCPCVISDIEEYRWVAGNAALYFDPHNVNDIREKIRELLFEKQSKALQKKLVALGTKQVKLYSVESVSKAWQKVLMEIKSVKRLESLQCRMTKRVSGFPPARE